MNRRGSLLIIVAGICALLATFATAFLWRMRAEASESESVVRMAQSRVMLSSACSCILESAIGQTSPTIADGRYPMYVQERPKYAVELTVVYEEDPPELTSGNGTQAKLPPEVVRPDPTRYVDQANPTGSDTTPRTNSVGLSWFRLKRVANLPSDPVTCVTFTVTVGAGTSEGFKDWNEVVSGGASGRFASDAVFRDIVGTEQRRWYRVVWEPMQMLQSIDTSMGNVPTLDPGTTLPTSATWADQVRASRPENAWRALGRIRSIQSLPAKLPSDTSW